MYKAVVWRYGYRSVTEFDSYESAKLFEEYADNMFVECILDENDYILKDNKKLVIGIKQNNERRKYVFD
ncbi:hypothetical protein [Brevibacillus porteri]|uniref:hypothetical protein n=1 Tax=Brevibacillus porteri TaxID=2126350 RepID=UPI003642E3A2